MMAAGQLFSPRGKITRANKRVSNATSKKTTSPKDHLEISNPMESQLQQEITGSISAACRCLSMMPMNINFGDFDSVVKVCTKQMTEKSSLSSAISNESDNDDLIEETKEIVVPVCRISSKRVMEQIKIPMAFPNSYYYKLMDNIAEHKAYKFYVRNIESPSRFIIEYICPKSTRNISSDLGDPKYYTDFQFFYNSDEMRKNLTLRDTPIVHRRYATQNNNGIWEHVRVISVDCYSQKAMVVTVDIRAELGFPRWVSWDKIFELAAHFIQEPTKMCWGKLHGLKPRTRLEWSEAACDFLRSVTENKVVFAYVKKKVLLHNSAELFAIGIEPMLKLSVELFVSLDSSTGKSDKINVNHELIKMDLTQYDPEALEK